MSAAVPRLSTARARILRTHVAEPAPTPTLYLRGLDTEAARVANASLPVHARIDGVSCESPVALSRVLTCEYALTQPVLSWLTFYTTVVPSRVFHLLANPRPIEILLSIAADSIEPLELRRKSLRALSCACHLTDDLRSMICGMDALGQLIKLVSDSDSTIRKLAVHCVFLLVLKNPGAQVHALHAREFEAAVVRVSGEDWTSFRANDAQRLLELVRCVL
ncbi:hypothetical protein HDU84_002414 [Entophlyctis sp. JEL0112]|nr:hypothetical protein HDU84_002414 [Entophlyctis sp. JEL0112]